MWDSKFRCIMQSNHGNFFWMSIVAQVVLLFTKTFIWRDKITLDVAKCLGWLLMHKLCLDATRDLYGWPLTLLDVYQFTSCATMYWDIFMDGQDNPSFSWMSRMTIDAQDYPGWLPILKITLIAAGCLLMLKLFPDAPIELYMLYSLYWWTSAKNVFAVISFKEWKICTFLDIFEKLVKSSVRFW